MITYKLAGRILGVSFLLLSVFALAVSGCGPSKDVPATAPVEGTVTYQGEPVESGTVTFFPEGGERPASGLLGANGEFTLTTYEKGDGAVLGTHKVVVVSMKDSATVGTGTSMDSAIPLKYSTPDTTPLSYEVEEGQNTFEISLED